MFSEEIEKYKLSKNIDSYIETIIMFCIEKNIDLELIGHQLKTNQNLRSKIQLEAEDLNFLKKGARLPI